MGVMQVGGTEEDTAATREGDTAAAILAEDIDERLHAKLSGNHRRIGIVTTASSRPMRAARQIKALHGCDKNCYPR